MALAGWVGPAGLLNEFVNFGRQESGMVGFEPTEIFSVGCRVDREIQKLVQSYRLRNMVKLHVKAPHECVFSNSKRQEA